MRRPATTHAEATRLIEALLERRFEGELPTPPPGMIFDQSVYLGRLPLAETLPLHGRALFATSSLTPEAREQAVWSRESFFNELGGAVGMSARVLLAAVRARRFPLTPPRVLAGYEYLGVFTSTGQLDVADPCHLRKTSRMPAGVFSLSYATEAARGPWHAFVRAGEEAQELAVIHADGFEVMATELVANIGVDAGMVGVFDRTCPPPVMTELRVDATVQGLGVFTRSGGDGIFPVFAGESQGVVTKLRISFADEHPESDMTVPRRASQRYAISTTFAVGDMIDHPKFGAGVVVRLVDGKIEVDFAEETRTLIHGKR